MLFSRVLKIIYGIDIVLWPLSFFLFFAKRDDVALSSPFPSHVALPLPQMQPSGLAPPLNYSTDPDFILSASAKMGKRLTEGAASDIFPGLLQLSDWRLKNASLTPTLSAPCPILNQNIKFYILHSMQKNQI